MAPIRSNAVVMGVVVCTTIVALLAITSVSIADAAELPSPLSSITSTPLLKRSREELDQQKESYTSKARSGSRTVTDFSHLHDTKELSVFTTIVISGKPGECRASISDAHTLPNKPAHPWYPLDLSKVASRDTMPVRNLSNIVPPLRSSTPKSKSTRFFLVEVDGAKKGDPSTAFTFQDPREMHAHDMMAHVERAESDQKDLHSSHGHGHSHSHSDGGEEGVHEVVYAVESAGQNIYFPAGTRKATLYCDTTNHSSAIVLDIGSFMGHDAPSQNRRRFLPSSANGIEVRTNNEVAPPDQTLNVVFVSGGYQEADREKFFNNISDLFKMLQDPGMDDQEGAEDDDLHDMHRSVPHNRYINFWNVYSVFQPSVDSGASRPLYQINLDNNLECVHPAQMERGLACRWELAQSLADVSPAGAKARPGKTLVIAIVNSALYGGTGSYLNNLRHFGTFFNGFDINNLLNDKKKMLSLMDHEIGHAYGGLADEYVAISANDFSNDYYENCQMGSGNTPPTTTSRWKWWIDQKANDPSGFHSTYGNNVINTNWGISDVPIQQCWYQNYFRPNANCMMNRLNDYFMCPVCREAATVNIIKNRFSLIWPRFPLEDGILVVSKADVGIADRITTNTTATLHLSRYLTSSNDFTVTVTDFGGAIIPSLGTSTCPACYEITPAMWNAYPVGQVVYINITVVDTSKFVSNPIKRALVDPGQFSQSGFFRLMVVNDISTAQTYATANNGELTLDAGVQRSTVGKALDDTSSRHILCVSVDPTRNATCNMSFPNRLYEAATNIDGELSAYDVWVFAIMGGLGVIYIGLWICACSKFSNKSRGVVRPIFRTEFNCVIQIVRIMMMISAVGFMAAAFGTLIASSYFYTKLSVLGKVVIFIGIGVSLLLYVLAFIGFWSVYSRSKRMLCINLLFLLIALGVILTSLILIQTWAEEIKETNSTLNEKLGEYWSEEVVSDPERLCGIQNELQCSGFTHSCATVVGSSNECPKNCEETNARWFSPCQYVIRDWIAANHVIPVQLLSVGVALLAVGIFFDIGTWIALRSMKHSIQRGNTKRVKEVSSMVSGGGGANKETQKKYTSILLLMSLSSRDTARLKKEFARIDKDKSGTLDKLEMATFLKKSLMHTPTRPEIDEIFAICDIDGDQVIDLREFLALFQHSSISNDKYSKIMHERLAQRGLLKKQAAQDPFSASPGSSPGSSPRNQSPKGKAPPKPVREGSLSDFL